MGMDIEGNFWVEETDPVLKDQVMARLRHNAEAGNLVVVKSAGYPALEEILEEARRVTIAKEW